MDTEEFVRREMDRFSKRADALDENMRQLETRMHKLDLAITEMKSGAIRTGLAGGGAGGIVVAISEGLRAVGVI